MYYLQSRYYDPATGRFINADSYASTGQGVLGYNMFAYCNNNPTCNDDPTGRIPTNLGNQVELYGSGGKNRQVEYKGAHGKIKGMINGQAVFEYAHSPSGIGTYAQNGCGIIAIYNAMQLLGHPQSLGSIDDEFFCVYGMIAGGLGGTGPWSYDNYFRAHGISYVGYGNYNDLQNNVSEGDVVVFTVMNNRNDITDGFHTMAAQYLNGSFIIYNINNTKTTPTVVTSLNLGGSFWLYGYIVGG